MIDSLRRFPGPVLANKRVQGKPNLVRGGGYLGITPSTVIAMPEFHLGKYMERRLNPKISLRQPASSRAQLTQVQFWEAASTDFE